ncbi:hypothetical protein C8J57DRAFT_1246915 [Mycena rebaudengoi]|nr:hypothetical protein C8J57DRAFT_1246915 [Mycena rebaudengoi]
MARMAASQTLYLGCFPRARGGFSTHGSAEEKYCSKSAQKRFAEVSNEWTSKGFMERVWSHGDFSHLADGVEFKISAFRDVYSASRLIALSKGQEAMDAKLCIVPA